MGRPRVRDKYRRESTTLRLPSWLLDWLMRQKESSGVVVENALIETYKLEPEEDEDE